jgi:DNA-binding CsgD family transcriptional regulator
MTEASATEEQLATIIRLLALSAAPDTLSLKERALRLQKAGMGPKEIAMICGTTPNTVSVALSAAKRAKRGPKQKPIAK